MAGVELTPQTMTMESLQEFMQNHALNTAVNTTREACVQSVENYLMEHLTRRVYDPLSRLAIDSPLGDLSRRRFSAADLFHTHYGLCSPKKISELLRKNDLKVPKWEEESDEQLERWLNARRY